jgi:hypothetical protein
MGNRQSNADQSIVQESDYPNVVSKNPSEKSTTMTRSTSVQAWNDKQSPSTLLQRREIQEPRYIPRGLDKAHNGIIMPRMPYGSSEPSHPSGSLDGVDSPQWGWFLRTSPNLPQMYQKSPTNHNTKHPSASDTSQSSDGSQSTVPVTNPVFAGLQDKQRAAAAYRGWSSVPL